MDSKVEIRIPRAKKLKPSDLDARSEQTVGIKEVIEEVLRSMSAPNGTTRVAASRKEGLTKADLFEIKSSIRDLEANINAQFNQVDHNVNALKSIVDDLQRTTNLRIEKWDSDLRSIHQEIRNNFDHDRAKYVKLLQKIQLKHDRDIAELKNQISEVQSSSASSVVGIKDDIQTLFRDISRTKQSTDSM